MAAAILREAFPQRHVGSAGIRALVGEGADEHAVRLLEKRNLDLTGHRARQLDGTLLYGCDLLLVMEQVHKEWVELVWPEACGRTYRWGHWSDFDVPDPYRKDGTAFSEALALLDRGLEDWKTRL